MFKTIQIAILILAYASIAAAQDTDYRKVEFYAGYSFAVVAHGINEDRILDDPEDYLGLNTSITRNVSRYAGFKFDFSAHEKMRFIPFGASPIGINLDSKLYNFSGGIQIKNNSSEAGFKPFVHALVGVAHIHNRVKVNQDVCAAIAPNPCLPDFTERDTGVAAILGGGIDIRAGDHFDIRIIQIDYNPTRLFDGSQRNLRIGLGIAFH